MSGRTAALVFAATVGLLVLAGTGLLPPPDEFRHDVDSWGPIGLLIAVGLALGHAIVAFPSEILNLAAGYAYGFWVALPVMMAGWMGSCLLAYGLARRFGGRIAARLVERDALDRMEAWAEDAPVPALLAVRAIPIVPINLVSYAAGLARMPLGRFTWTTFAGLLPQYVVVIYAGSRARDVALTDPLVLASAFAWLSLILIGWAIYRRFGGRAAEAAAD